MNRSILIGDFDLPSTPFPSLEALPATSSLRRRKQVGTEEPLHFLATSATALSKELSSNATTKESIKKPKVVEEPVVKRPVGRPRLYPKKELDPNRIRRGPSIFQDIMIQIVFLLLRYFTLLILFLFFAVARGDKPLGRPRTAHLKPPVGVHCLSPFAIFSLITICHPCHCL